MFSLTLDAAISLVYSEANRFNASPISLPAYNGKYSEIAFTVLNLGIVSVAVSVIFISPIIFLSLLNAMEGSASALD